MQAVAEGRQLQQVRCISGPDVKLDVGFFLGGGSFGWRR
jgi:hypothetical protein